MPRDFGRRRMRKKRARACFCEEVVFEMEEEREVGERDGVGAEVEHAERGGGGGCGLERGDGLWGEAVAMEVGGGGGGAGGGGARRGGGGGKGFPPGVGGGREGVRREAGCERGELRGGEKVVAEI